MTAPRTLTHRQLKALGKRLHTDTGMAELMNATFGSDGWVYDAADELWVAQDPRHEGEGRSYYLVRRGGNWTKALLRDEVLS
jgi:hypothetical protein